MDKFTMQLKRSHWSKRVIVMLLAVALILSSTPILPGLHYALAATELGTGDLVTSTPVLAVTGQGLWEEDSGYTADNVSNEKTYTLAELKALTDITQTNFYSAINSTGTKSIFKGEGVTISGLLARSNVSPTSVNLAAGDFVRNLDLSVTRSYYPNVASDDPSGSAAVDAIIAWSQGGKRGNTSTELELTSLDSLESMVGQTAVDDKNNSMFVSGLDQLRVGDAISDVVLTVGDKTYTRAQLMMLSRAAYAYTYSTKGGDATDYVRGVPLAVLADGHDGDEIISFTTVDSYAGISEYSTTLTDAISKNYLIAYEESEDQGASYTGLYLTGKSDATQIGYLKLYATGSKPASMVNAVAFAEPTPSKYKHVNNGGLAGSSPYNIDAITGATLTVEGPGVSKTTPIRIGDLERTDNANIYKGKYTDTRNASTATLYYEGVTVKSIIDGLVNENVEKVDENVKIVFKNRWRQDVATITYGELAQAATPVILAYGTGTEDESKVAPFVFNNSAGYDADLGNDDGCLKLVYDKSDSALSGVQSPDKFASVAYLYIERGGEQPGFKHTTATSDAYKTAENTEHLITFTGTALGREVNYTVADLEAMVEYDEEGKPKADGLGYRASYGLSNTTYWYVNEYEGVKLWDLLTTKLGLDADTYKDDDETLVSFAAWDNYKTQAQFSMKQLATPDLFYFYEKSPLDIGTDRPTKEELATEAYQPDNQVGEWTTDSNGYPVKKGYPVVLAYGVNGYPYVRDNTNTEGYAGGLGNDGGPMKVIFGKADGMNRSNASAVENYAYFYNNGSNQLQRAQEIYVGDDKRYSTHMENPSYQSMANTADALTVEVVSSGGTETKTYTLAELESVLYGENVSKTDMENQGRREKGYYAYKEKGGLIEDLFEGVNIDYLLTEEIGMPGVLGSVSFYSGASDTSPLTVNLADLKAEGSNSLRDTSGLGTMLAFAKNGYPMVDGKETGYVSEDADTGLTIKNNGGPLMYLRAQTDAEKAAGKVGDDAYKENITKIVVNLEADVYAHTDGDYKSYADQTVTFEGSVTQDGATLKVGDIEKLQKYIVDDSYSVGGTSQTYRGIDLLKLLSDKSVGASALMNEIVVENAEGDTKTLSVGDLNAAGKRVILAYGVAGGAAADPAGKPLVPTTTSTGYDADYLNSGGPLRLVIDGAAAADCITNVSKITVKAAELLGWTHSAGHYAEYANNTIEFSGTNLKNNKTMTVADIEAMSDTYKYSGKFKVGNEYYFEGVDLLKVLRDYIGFAGSLDTSSITVYAKDNYAITFTGSQLKDGINGLPMILAYGQGTTATNGLPLVDSDSSNGYDPTIDNAYGPLRLVVNDNTGWCNKWVTKIVVGDEGGTEEVTSYDFSIKLNDTTLGYTIKDLKGMTGGKAEASYKYYSSSAEASVTDYVKGIALKDVLAAAGVEGDSITVTINTIDGFKGEQYTDIPLADIISQEYFIAHDVKSSSDAEYDKIEDVDKNSVTASVRIYRNFNAGETAADRYHNRVTGVSGITINGLDYSFSVYPGTGSANQLPMASVRDIVLDSAGGMWVGTNGGGASYKAVNSNDFAVSTLSTAGYILASDVVQAIAIDKDGGIWFSQSKTYDPTQASQNKGVAYLKDGKITYYNTSVGGTIPNDYVQEIKIDANDNVWFGSFAGLTKYDVKTKSWTTWSSAAGLPATSVDTIAFDSRGGVWIGCYPDGAGTQASPFSGGYAYMDKDGEITAYSYTADYNASIGSSQLADVWVRDIAIDSKNGAWIVRSGSYGDLENVGGRVDYIDADGNVTHYTGKQLLPELETLKTASTKPEIRTVTVDGSGNILFGTSGLGVYRLNSSLQVTNHYWSGSNDWPSGGYDNIFVVDVTSTKDTIYVGSNSGVSVGAYSTGTGSGSGGGSSTGTPIGDATADDFDLAITGAVVNPGYFTIKGLKNYPGVQAETLNYDWLNSYGSTGKVAATGVTLENLLTDVMVLKSGAQSVKLIAADGYERSFNLNTDKYGVYWADKDGNKMMLAWQQDGDKCDLTLIIGQGDTTDVNKPMWVSSITEIVVYSSSTSSGSGTPGKYDPTTPAETPTETELSKDGSLAYIKGYEGNLFHPNDNMTRAEVIVMFSRLLAEQPDANKTYTSSFTDVPENAWYANEVGFMEQFRIINGDGDGSFRPEDPITRSEFVAIAAAIKGQNGTVRPIFGDVPTGHWANSLIALAVEQKWAEGYPDGLFHPNAPITRAEVVTMTNRVLGRTADEAYIRNNLSDLTSFTDVPTDHWAYLDIMEAANGHK